MQFALTKEHVAVVGMFAALSDQAVKMANALE
jgi:hypothetical protein